jgi:hypothetical protein
MPHNRTGCGAFSYSKIHGVEKHEKKALFDSVIVEARVYFKTSSAFSLTQGKRQVYPSSSLNAMRGSGTEPIQIGEEADLEKDSAHRP